MTEGTFSRKLRSIACIVGCWLGLAATVSAADIQMQVQAAPGQPSALSPTGKLLTIEDAVRIGLDNHPQNQIVKRAGGIATGGARPTDVGLLSNDQPDQSLPDRYRFRHHRRLPQGGFFSKPGELST